MSNESKFTIAHSSSDYAGDPDIKIGELQQLSTLVYIQIVTAYGPCLVPSIRFYLFSWISPRCPHMPGHVDYSFPSVFGLILKPLSYLISLSLILTFFLSPH